jgi:hypothetical protein
MNLTPTVALVIINIIAFAVYTYGLIALIPILKAVFKAGKGAEIQIAGQVWKVSYKLLALTTTPFLVYPVIILTYAWVIYRIIA